jgi:transcriptional regulator with XRE-family HTH domain
MAAAQRKHVATVVASEDAKRSRKDPDRLKAFADRFNLMLNELGMPERGRARALKERVGVSGTTAANWLRGESYPSFEEIARIRQNLGVDPVGLFDSSREVAISTAVATLPTMGLPPRLARLIQEGQIAPLVQLRTDNGDWDHTAVPNSVWTQLLGRSLSGFVLLRMRGNAMADRIRDGTLLLVDTNDVQVSDDNGVYALLLGDAIIVRRVQRRLQGGYVIASDNPEIPPEQIDRLGSYRDHAKAGSSVAILGRVALAIQTL